MTRDAVRLVLLVGGVIASAIVPSHAQSRSSATNPAEAGSYVLAGVTAAPGDGVVGSAFSQMLLDAGVDQATPPQKPDPKGAPKPETTKSKPQSPASAPKDPRPRFTIRGSFDLALASYSAKDAFESVYDSSTGLMWGGTAQLAHRSGWFVQGRLWSYSATGERVFVYNNEVFPLGIPSKLTVTPLEVSGGWRFVRRPRAAAPPGKPGTPPSPSPAASGRPQTPTTGKPATPPPAGPPSRPASTATVKQQRVIPYVGGGIGTVNLKETAEFAGAGDNVDQSSTSYHLFGGAEFPLRSWVGVGAEVGWRMVPGALEGTGAADAFGETDLDHLYIAVRIIVGK